MKKIYSIVNLSLIVLGSFLLIAGFALLFLPGPGIPLIILGLVILAGHFVWARKVLNKVKKGSRSIIKKSKKIVKSF
ncbi:MAG: PGPGW domain-containing protein [Nanoarchaeota archaeon]